MANCIWGLFCCIRAVIVYIGSFLAITSVAILCLFSYIKYSIISIFMRIFTGKYFEILSGQETLPNFTGRSSFVDPTCAMTINAMAVVNGIPDMERITTVVRERIIVKHKRLKQMVVRKFGYFAFEEDKEFSMDNRVQLHGQGYTDDESLFKLFQKFHEIPITRKGSPWEFIIIPKICKNDEPDEYTILLRLHHQLYDGVGVMMVAADLFDQETRNVTDHATVLKSTDRLPPIIQCNPFLLYLATPRAKRTIRDVFAIIFNALEIIFMSPWYATAPLAYRKETNALNLPVFILTGRKLMGIRRLELQVFKDIAAIYGCSINDIFLHCLSGAYERCNEAAPIETDSYLRIIMIIYLIMSRNLSKNGVTCAVAEYPLQDDNPVNRLKTIAAISKRERTSVAPICHFLLIRMLANHLPVFLAKHFFSGQVPFSVLCSNLRAPTTTQYMFGNEITRLFFLPNNVNNCAVTFGLASYTGQVSVTATVDRIVAPDDHIAQQLLDDFTKELIDLHDIAMREKQFPCKEEC